MALACLGKYFLAADYETAWNEPSAYKRLSSSSFSSSFPFFLSWKKRRGAEEGMDIRRGVYMIYNARKGAWLTCEIFGGNGWRGGRGRASCTFSTFSARVRAWNRPEKGPLLSVGQRRRLLEITNLLEKEREGRRRIGLDWLRFNAIRFYVPSTLPINIVIYIWSRIFHFPVCSLNSMREREGERGALSILLHWNIVSTSH